MEPIFLRYPVKDLDGHELLPAGAHVDEQRMRELIDSRPDPGRDPVLLLEHGTIAADLRRYCAEEPYDRVFGGAPGIEGIMSCLESASLPNYLVQVLDHFAAEDFETYRHSLVVYAVALQVARAMGLSGAALREFVECGPTHDFGKLSIDYEVLNKREPLTREERLHLGHHANAGYVLLAYGFGHCSAPACRAACDHHERKDGSGYTRGVPLVDELVEVVSICDIFDALISPRPYRGGIYDARAALDELIGMAQRGKFSWPTIQALVSLNRAGHPDARSITLSQRRRAVPPGENAHGILADP